MIYRGPIKWPINIGDSKTRTFDLHYFEIDEKRYVAAELGDLDAEPVLLRIESACVFGHIFRGRKCDCGDQFEMALRQIIAEGQGLAIYALDDDARGHGVEMHFRLYEFRQHEGRMDEREIFDELGLEIDVRDYGPVVDILDEFSVEAVELMTNNPKRVEILEENGIRVTERIPLETEISEYNEKLLLQEKEWIGYETSYRTLEEWVGEFDSRLADSDATHGFMITEDHSVVSTAKFATSPPTIELEDANASEHFTTCFLNFTPLGDLPTEIDKVIRVDGNDLIEYDLDEIGETTVSD
jgi:GTP cyclohydrolase II